MSITFRGRRFSTAGAAPALFSPPETVGDQGAGAVIDKCSKPVSTFRQPRFVNSRRPRSVLLRRRKKGKLFLDFRRGRPYGAPAEKASGKCKKFSFVFEPVINLFSTLFRPVIDPLSSRCPRSGRRFHGSARRPADRSPRPGGPPRPPP